MNAEPSPPGGLVAVLDENRTLDLNRIPAENISRLISRIIPAEHRETTIDIAAFNSSI
jgi:hypothetical protein